MSRRQYILSLGLLTIPFKLSVLPKYLALYLKKDGFVAIVLICLMELLITLAVYKTSEKGGITKVSKGILGKIFIIFASFALCVKLTLAITELFYYCSSSLFEGANSLVFLLTSIPVAFYLGKRKDYSFGRIAQMIVPIIYFTLFVNIAFSTAKPQMANMLPLFDTPFKDTALFSLKYLWYTGDALPLIFVGITPSEKDLKPAFAYLRIALHTLIVIGFYVLFYAVYSDSLMYIDDVFNRIASFNSLTGDINALELLTIISWTSATIFAVGAYAHAFSVASNALFKKNALSNVLYVSYFAVAVTLGILMTNYLTYFEKIFTLSAFAYVGMASLIIALLSFAFSLKEKVNPCANVLQT